MDDIVERMRGEEADLVRKLEAVRQFLAAYGGPAPAPKVQASARVSRPSLSARSDKFGSYGKRIIDAALTLLPDPDATPMLTRELVDRLEFEGVEIRGENKVNALSALLARSSQTKGHGRAGWTRASAKSTEEISGLDAQNETKALNGNAASASVVAKPDAPTPGMAAWINPDPGWHS